MATRFQHVRKLLWVRGGSAPHVQHANKVARGGVGWGEWRPCWDTKKAEFIVCRERGPRQTAEFICCWPAALRCLGAFGAVVCSGPSLLTVPLHLRICIQTAENGRVSSAPSCLRSTLTILLLLLSVLRFAEEFNLRSI